MSRFFNNSASDLINLGSSSVLGIANPASISAWLYPTGFSNSVNQVFLKNNANTNFYGMNLNGTGELVCQATNGSVHTTSTFSTNAWTHAGWTVDGSGNASVYIDGSSAATGTTSWSSPTTATAAIGYDAVNTGRNFQGRIADLAVWSTALTAAEIMALNNGARPYTIRSGSLIGYWPIYGFQSPEPDLSGNANNGTITGTTSAADPPVMMFTPRWPQFNPAAAVSTATFRKSLSALGTRVGTRQVHF